MSEYPLRLILSPNDKPVISHSEAETFTLCERKHYYSFGEKISRTKKPDALTRGQLGHKLMQAFFTNYRDTHDFDVAFEEMVKKSAELFTADNAKNLVYLLQTIQGFFNHHRQRIERWTVVHVEETFRLELQDFIYAFTPDIIVEENGQLVVVDWKFVYDFYDQEFIDMAPQIPRYVGALRALGIHVSHGWYAFLRYRNIKEDGEGNRFKLQECKPNGARVQNSFKDLILSVKPISLQKELNLIQWKDNSRRTADQKICSKMCDFKQLCSAELNGSDGILIRQMSYEKSDYGY